MKRYLLDFRLVDEWFTNFDSGCVDFINISLLSFLIKTLDDLFDDFFLSVGMISGQYQTCGSSHTCELSVVVSTIDLSIDCGDAE